jgi:hypothetical protein
VDYTRFLSPISSLHKFQLFSPINMYSPYTVPYGVSYTPSPSVVNLLCSVCGQHLQCAPAVVVLQCPRCFNLTDRRPPQQQPPQQPPQPPRPPSVAAPVAGAQKSSLPPASQAIAASASQSAPPLTEVQRGELYVHQVRMRDQAAQYCNQLSFQMQMDAMRARHQMTMDTLRTHRQINYDITHIGMNNNPYRY